MRAGRMHGKRDAMLFLGRGWAWRGAEEVCGAAEHPCSLTASTGWSRGAESGEDRGRSGCALARSAVRLACLRLCDQLIGKASGELRADWLGGPPLRPRSGRFLLRLGTGSAPASACAPAAPRPAPARLGPAPASERRRRCRLGRSQGHEEAAAATAARVKVTGRDCGGVGGGSGR